MTIKHISDAHPAEDASLPADPDQRPCILVVEDDPDIRILNSEILAASGYRVDAAEDGAVAWDLLQSNRYDLMITDHNMPRMTGLELLEKLHSARLELPVILATGSPIQEELDRAPWLQVEAILLKPYTFDELLGMVKNILHLADSQSWQPPTPVGRQTQNGFGSLRAYSGLAGRR